MVDTFVNIWTSSPDSRETNLMHKSIDNNQYYNISSSKHTTAVSNATMVCILQ